MFQYMAKNVSRETIYGMIVGAIINRPKSGLTKRFMQSLRKNILGNEVKLSGKTNKTLRAGQSDFRRRDCRI